MCAVAAATTDRVADRARVGAVERPRHRPQPAWAQTPVEAGAEVRGDAIGLLAQRIATDRRPRAVERQAELAGALRRGDLAVDRGADVLTDRLGIGRVGAEAAAERHQGAVRPLVEARRLAFRCRRGDVALRFGQRGGLLVFAVDVEPPALSDGEQVELTLRRVAAALRGPLVGELHRRCPEAAAQHEVHHLLVGGIAVFQRDLFGQDVDAQDRFGGDVADFLEARDAMSVEQHDWRSARAAARLGSEFAEQVGHAADAIAAHVGGPERLFGGNVADHRAWRSAALDDDVALLALLLIGGGSRRWGWRRRWGLRCSGRRGRGRSRRRCSGRRHRRFGRRYLRERHRRPARRHHHRRNDPHASLIPFTRRRSSWRRVAPKRQLSHECARAVAIPWDCDAESAGGWPISSPVPESPPRPGAACP